MNCIKLKELVTSNKTRGWCLLPYPNHPKGCPNYRKKCRWGAPPIEFYFDLYKPMYAVFSEFNLEAHMERMKKKHPKWSNRQARCVLYWQSTSRKQLKEQIQLARNRFDCNIVSTCPEWLGVNVYATLAQSGLRLEKIKDLKICRHVALIGTRRKEKDDIRTKKIREYEDMEDDKLLWKGLA